MPKITHPYTVFSSKLRSQHLLRHLPRHQNYLYDFSSNDYLGLSQNPSLIQAAQYCAQQYGVSSKASRLVSSDQKQINDLENIIAKDKGTQSALIFNSGYQANISVLSALLDQKVLGAVPLVFSDRLNHASMHAGCQLAGVKQHRFHHLDYDHLAFLLKTKANNKQPIFILTESVFGMDGDVASLENIIKLAKPYQAFIYVDEAHATGLFGKHGYGLTSDYANDITLSMGTFSKGLGGSGAYIACNKALKRYLVNKCQGFVFSTAPSPMQVGVMQAAWELVPSLQNEVKNLFERAQQLRDDLHKLGFKTCNSSTHIIPIILEDAATTMKAQQYLSEQGIRVSAIRPPSVPPQQSRLRIALNLKHDEQAIGKLLLALGSLPFQALKA